MEDNPSMTIRYKNWKKCRQNENGREEDESPDMDSAYRTIQERKIQQSVQKREVRTESIRKWQQHWDDGTKGW